METGMHTYVVKKKDYTGPAGLIGKILLHEIVKKTFKIPKQFKISYTYLRSDLE